MYIPPLSAIVRSLRIDPAVLDSNARVPVPGRVLKMLLKLAIANSKFDADSYLDRNPDIREALLSGQVESAAEHFCNYGYFENRRGATQVDTAYYTVKYPDVASAILQGGVSDAEEHYYSSGCLEGRSPNRESEADVASWLKALQG